jgi:hypothetical protein
MDKISLKTYVEKHPELITCKQSKEYPDLYVLKYKNKCFYKNIWNRYIEVCRGLVIDKDYNIIVNPFDKIYNFGIESNAPKVDDSEVILAVRKINGFMSAVSKYNGELIVSTTGSLDSDFANLAKSWINKSTFFNDILEGQTYLFEVVDPSDPHIIQETSGLYFIGQRSNEFNSKINYVTALNLYLSSDPNYRSSFNQDEYTNKGIVILPQIITTLGELKQHVKTVKHEGYVFYTKDGRASKIKSPFYLVSKFFARKKDIHDLFSKNVKNRIDEEFYPLVDYIKKNKDEFSLLSEQDRLVYIRTFLETYLND